MSKTIQSKQCVNCGKTFTNTGSNRVSATRWATRQICSWECKKVESRPDYKHSKECLTCGKAFYRPENQRGYMWLKRQYCNSKCANSRPERTRVTKDCAICGKDFWARGNSAKRKTCSYKCGGELHSDQNSGAGHWNWKGGRTKTAQGYIWVHVSKDHQYKELRQVGGRVLEHRLIMSEMLGRPMTSTETVHHKNGKRDDNSPENLELRTGPHGVGATKHCLTCTC